MVLTEYEEHPGNAGSATMVESSTIVVSEAQAVQAISELLEDRGADAGEVHGDTPLDELGLDSLEFAELFMLLEESFGVRFDPASAKDLSTVADFTKLRPFGASHG